MCCRHFNFFVADLFCCHRFSVFFSPLYFIAAALVFFSHRFSFLLLLYLFLPVNWQRKYQAAKKKTARKMRKQRQSNNKAATKNTERLCIAHLGLRIEQNIH